MRVNNSRFHCSSYCFSKPVPSPGTPPPDPPSSPLQEPSPVQCKTHSLESKDLEYQKCSEVFTGPLVIEEKLCDEKLDICENGVDGRKREFVLKSSLKKSSSSASKDVVRECVKWMDELGEELVEIREFEPIESGELDDAMNGYSTCTCVIL